MRKDEKEENEQKEDGEKRKEEEKHTCDENIGSKSCLKMPKFV